MQFATDREICELLGKADIFFAGLEDLIEFYIWYFATPGDQKMGQAMTAEMQFHSILQTVIAVFKIKFPHDEYGLKKLCSLVRRADTVARERNVYIHSSYMPGSTVGKLTQMKRSTRDKTGLKNDFKDITSDVLEDFIEKIDVLAADLQEFFNTVTIPNYKRK